MQNSQQFRRGVVVPLDDRAEEALRGCNVDASTQVLYLPIADDSLFGKVWDCGLFQEVNGRCGTIIDDYEEELIEVDQLPNLVTAIVAVAERVTKTDSDVSVFLTEFLRLATTASGLKRPVLVVL